MHRQTKTASKWIAALALGIGTLLLSGMQATAGEKGLVGVRVGRTGLEVLRIYGNPTRVQADSASGWQASQQNTTSSMPLMESPGGVPGGMPGPLPPGVPGAPEMVSPMPVMPQPGMPSPTVDTMSTTGTTTPAPSNQGVIWTYELPKARTLDVYVDAEGMVDQVRVSGFSWASAKTLKGITLGNDYKTVLRKYGFPNSHEYRNGLWLLHYTDPDNVTFVVDPKRLKVVAISVFRPN